MNCLDTELEKLIPCAVTKPFLWYAKRVEDFNSEEKDIWETIAKTVRPEYEKLTDRDKSDFSK